MTPDEPSDSSDDQQPGPGSVADEAMRLAEVFATWAQNSKVASEQAAAESRGQTTGCDCGHGSAVESVCRMCPVCRLAGVVQAVQPDLLDRVADLLGVVAGGLHSAAQQRRESDQATHDRD